MESNEGISQSQNAPRSAYISPTECEVCAYHIKCYHDRVEANVTNTAAFYLVPNSSGQGHNLIRINNNGRMRVVHACLPTETQVRNLLELCVPVSLSFYCQIIPPTAVDIFKAVSTWHFDYFTCRESKQNSAPAMYCIVSYSSYFHLFLFLRPCTFEVTALTCRFFTIMFLGEDLGSLNMHIMTNCPLMAFYHTSSGFSQI